MRVTASAQFGREHATEKPLSIESIILLGW